MTFRDILLLYLIDRLNGERTLAGMYHLLNGKRSGQTIQDAYLFNVTQLFGVFDHLSKQEIMNTVHQLHAQAYIKEVSDDKFALTEAGRKALTLVLEESSLLPSELNGFKFKQQGQRFWRRFSLFIQSLSHVTANDYRFLPITKDKQTHIWVKRHFPKTPQKQRLWANAIHREGIRLLANFRDLESELFVRRLSGFGRVGLTTEQVADDLNIDRDEAYVMFQSVCHGICRMVAEQHEDYPYFLHLTGQPSQITLTDSAQRTYELMKNGASVADIVAYRNLKQSTIEDHIVEIAINDPNFWIDQYVPIAIKTEIETVLNNLGGNRLKPIKDAVSEHVSYFQIRLVLARKRLKNGKA